MAEWRKLSFEVPVLESLTDDELTATFTRLDGKWQPYIKEALDHFEADGLQLDENWASTPAWWTCPVCKRAKPQLLRLTDSNILLASLHWHHDHSNSYIKDHLEAEFGNNYLEHISRESVHLLGLGSSLIERFTDTLVCGDCNTVEGKAKSDLKIGTYFSFRPSEIADFIRMPSPPNVVHEFNFARAQTIWEAAEDNLRQRLEFADLLIEKIKSGSLTREFSPHRSPGEYTPERFIRDYARPTLHDEMLAIGRDLNALSTRSIARDGVGSSKKRRRISGPEAPSEEEFSAYDGGGSPDNWQLAGEHWRCPICKRTKFEIIRRSQKGKRRWTGFIQKHNEFEIAEPYYDGNEDEEDFSSPDVRIDRHQIHLICGDCSTVATGLKQRKPEFSNTDTFLQIADIRRAIASNPHKPHKIEWDVVEECARKNKEQLPAIAAYWKHLQFSVARRWDWKQYQKRNRGDRSRLWTGFVAATAQGWGMSAEETESLLCFSLSEAERLQPEDSEADIDGRQPELPPVWDLIDE